ncbi:MAG: RNA-binding S4 domain-containing protein, partial [Hyphomicrobium sp.]
VQRLDQWMWFARVTKSRTLAQALIERGKVRVNGSKVDRPSIAVKPTDVLTVSAGPRVRIIAIKAIGVRRGPATEAQGLFEELTPEPDRTKSTAKDKTPGGDLPDGGLATAVRPSGAGRPTKRERRDMERLKDRSREG